MIKAVAILTQVLALTVGATGAAAAESTAPAGDLQIAATLDAISNEDLIDAIIAIAPGAPSPDVGELMAEPAMAADGDWNDVAKSGVAYPVTSSISVGLAYHLEEIEDLTAELIEMGTAGVDYTSHKVLVRAEWQFDLVLP